MTVSWEWKWYVVHFSSAITLVSGLLPKLPVIVALGTSTIVALVLIVLAIRFDSLLPAISTTSTRYSRIKTIVLFLSFSE